MSPTYPFHSLQMKRSCVALLIPFFLLESELTHIKTTTVEAVYKDMLLPLFSQMN
jgi:hypothetical protein